MGSRGDHPKGPAPQNDARSLRTQAAAALAAGDLDGALAAYELVCELDPSDPVAPHRAGELLARRRRTREAIARLRTAADLYAHAGFSLKAIALCRIILHLDPGNLEAQYALWALQDEVLGQKPRKPAQPAAEPPGPEARRPAPPVREELKALPDRPTLPPDGTPQPSLADADAIFCNSLETELGDLRRVPRVQVRTEDLLGLELTPREAFLLHHVDGFLTYEDLLDVCGMPRLEALEIILRLITAGIVTHGERG